MSEPIILKSYPANTTEMNSWLVHGLMHMVILSSKVTASQLDAQEVTNMGQSTFVSDPIQAQNDNQSLIGSVINITNHTNPVGAAIQQMIQSTSITNTTATSPSVSTSIASFKHY